MKRRRGRRQSSELDKLRRWSGCCQQCRSPELFPARAKVFSCMAPLYHHVDGGEFPVCGTDLYRFSIRTRRGLISAAAVTPLSQGSQRLHHPMLNQFQMGEDKAVLNVRVACSVKSCLTHESAAIAGLMGLRQVWLKKCSIPGPRKGPRGVIKR